MKQVAAILFGAATVLAGCTTAASYNAWIGESHEELIANWGPPIDTWTLSDGRSTMTYISGTCRFTVFTDRAGRVSEIRTSRYECTGVNDIPTAPPDS